MPQHLCERCGSIAGCWWSGWTTPEVSFASLSWFLHRLNNWAACSKLPTCMYSSLLQKYNLILIWFVCLGPEELSRLAAPPVGSCNFQTFWQWARLHWSSFDWWYQVLEIIEDRYLDEWFHCPPIPETTLRGTNVFLSTREQGAGSRRWLKRRCLLYSRCYEVFDGNGKFLGEIFFGENSAGQTKWKCLELSAGERLCLKIIERDGQRVCSGCSGCLHRFWMRQRATRISRLKMQVAFVLPKLLMVIVICLKQLFPLYNIHVLFAFRILLFAFAYPILQLHSIFKMFTSRALLADGCDSPYLLGFLVELLQWRLEGEQDDVQVYKIT